MAEKTNPTPTAAPKAETKSSERFERMFEQMAEMDQKNRQAAYEAIEEYAKLMKASVDYAGRLNDEWRRLALETSRRAAEVMTVWV